MSDEPVMLALGEDYPELRESIRKICEKYPGSYWRGLEEAQAYPTEFINELTEGGFLSSLIPEEYGGSGLPLRAAAVILEEINASGCTASQGHAQMYIMGTLLRHGSAAQKERYLPKIASGELRLQAFGVTEPTTGSDTTKLKTRAVRAGNGDHYLVTGQKVWTSLAHVADWCFVLARTEPGSRRSAGLSMLLVPMRQPGVTVRPIRQLTGTSEFNEVFFDGARTDAGLVLGAPGDGWRVARYLLGVERGAATFGQQIQFNAEFDGVVALARRTGAAADPVLRERIARAWVGLEVLRAYALDTIGEAQAGPEASVQKLLWARWHKELGELAMDVSGADGMIAAAAPYELDQWQRLYLFSRTDTIYGGSDEIQLGIIAARALGLPREPVVPAVRA